MAQHRQSILIIILVSLIAFGNSVSNGFVGDDYILVVKNSFYDSWSNFPKLFSPSYITESDDVFNKETYFHTGSIAYRPVLSSSFFIDNWLWQRNPFGTLRGAEGYHAHNLLLHILNSALVYFILFLILKDLPLALFSAILFVVHPFKSEAVCAIGYRADILAAFFFLLAFLAHIVRDRFRGARHRIVVFLSHAALFLAVFAKESAVVFIGVLMAYDVLVKKEKAEDVLKYLYGRYLGYALVTLFYLYIYLHVFRNSTLDNIRFLGGNILTHVSIAVAIFVQYLTGFIFPGTVKVLPPLYAPPAGYAAWAGLVLFILLAYKVCRRPINSNTTVFFVAWFLVTLVPVSNVIPLVSPVAYRFLYLPSVGLLAAGGILLSKAGAYLDRRLRGMRVGAALRWGIIALCAIQTIALNMAWKSNLMMATMMVRDFPRFPTGYLQLGMEYFKKGDVIKARRALQTGFENGLQDARGYHYMGLCYFNDWERARPYYEESIRQFPYYALSYVGLGRIDVLGGHYAEAIPYLEKAIVLSPSYAGYGYLIQAYLRTDRPDDALAVYRQAQNKVREKSQLDSLEKFIQEGSNLRGSVDIGI